jgi:methionyl-tRNA synthetase
MMVSGSDSHGTPVSVRAEAEGRSPREVFEHWHRSILDTYQGLGIAFDLYTHTDTANHRRVAQDLFLQLRDSEALFVESQPQLYAPGAGRYLPDRLVEGTCPHCGYTHARGDQCPNCGRLLDALELVEPHARFEGGGQLEVHEREHYFLDLPQFSERLVDWLAAQEEWRSAVQNGSLGFVREGLRPRAITRDLDWGVPVPLEGWEERVLYVWFEAVMGYLSGSIELAELEGRPEGWRDYWYGDEAGHYYFMGKDNTIFHTVIWPAILMGVERYRPGDATGGLRLPTDVVANEYVNLERCPPAGTGRSGCRSTWRATTRTRCATTSPSTPRRPATSTSPGPTSSAPTTTSSWPPGATSSTASCA